MSTTSQLNPRTRAAVIRADRWIHWLSRHWMLAFSLVYGLFVALPFMGPVFMQVGWQGGGHAIYSFYSFVCHQLPERSLFLFGPKTMYGLSEIQAAWQNTINPMVLRDFIGNPAMGWKVAWSDRMVSMYTGLLLFAWLWWPLRKRVKPLPLWALSLFLLPMFVDGVTHTLSDLAGIGQGFRYGNAWLAALTGNMLPPSFYGGDALGSFNSWMRWITGLLFGMGLVWVVFPHMDRWFGAIAGLIEARFERANLTI